MRALAVALATEVLTTPPRLLNARKFFLYAFLSRDDDNPRRVN